MSSDTDPKTESRSSAEGDWIARQFLSAEDLQQSPEEYAARHAHLWGCFSLHQYHYADPKLGAWVRRLGEILSSKEEIERCRCRFHTPEQLAGIRNEEANGL